MTGCEIALLALTLNIWHEARGEPLEGQKAVADTTIMRLRSKHYPDDIHKVVTQRRQFSWAIGQGVGEPQRLLELASKVTASLNTPRDIKAWQQAEAVSKRVLAEEYKPRYKFTMFHTTDTKPYWSQGRKGTVIGSHKFYL